MPDMAGETGSMVSAREHYDRLIAEGDDPVLDPPALRAYMDGWDGEALFQALKLNGECRVLEIGVGTGRLALRALQRGCAQFTGMDLSERTLERARLHLAGYEHVRLMRGEFPWDAPAGQFERIYSSLTFFHIPGKRAAVEKMVSLLTPGGRAVISADRGGEAVLDYGTRQVRMYPDDADCLAELFLRAGCRVEPAVELERARLVVAVRPEGVSKFPEK